MFVFAKIGHSNLVSWPEVVGCLNRSLMQHMRIEACYKAVVL